MHICIFRKGQKWCNIQGKIKKKRKKWKIMWFTTC